jgi:RNA polymerase sigma-70 factor (ECF subfamily)
VAAFDNQPCRPDDDLRVYNHRHPGKFAFLFSAALADVRRRGRRPAKFFERFSVSIRLRCEAVELDNQRALDLLKLVAAGNEGAFRAIYEATSRRVYAYALHRLGEPAAAEDVMTETLYELWRAPDRFRGDAKFSTWLLAIARHKIIDRMRTQRTAHEDVDELADVLATDEPDAFEAVAESERREGVMRCMEKLPDAHKESLYLVFYEGMSLAEVSALQAVPENTVKTRLFHARNNIKRCLKLLLLREGGHG